MPTQDSDLSKLLPRLAESDAEIMRCFGVMSELRPHLKQDEFLPLVRSMQDEGFCLLYLQDDEDIVAVAGFRIGHNLFMGKHLYVDDLVTQSTKRSRGYGDILLNWLRDFARAQNCSHLHLDSGVQRKSAHKFYFRCGLSIASYHFSEQLD